MIQTRKVLALVQYSSTMNLPREFLAHEIPILQNLNNGNRITVENDNMAPGPLMSARDILVSLRKTYGSKKSASGDSVVDETFPDGSRDIEAFYAGEYTPPSVEIVGEDLSGDDIVLKPPITGAQTEMDREDIKTKLNLLGIPFSPNTPTKHLAALLDNSVETDE